MNKIENALRLKKFIEIIDSEIFPKNPIPVFIWKKRWSSRNEDNLAAFVIINSKSYWSAFCSALWVIGTYVFTWPCTTKNLRASRLSALSNLTFNIRNLSQRFYQIRLVQKEIYTDAFLLYIAAHEVRHRVQFSEISEHICTEADIYTTEWFKISRERNEEWFLERNKLGAYNESEKTVEIDADFVGLHLRRLFLKVFSEETRLTDDQLRIFIRTFKEIILWKNPALEHCSRA